MGSVATYSAVALRGTQVRVSARGPFLIPSPPLSLPVHFLSTYCPIIMKAKNAEKKKIGKPPVDRKMCLWSIQVMLERYRIYESNAHEPKSPKFTSWGRVSEKRGGIPQYIIGI